MITNILVKSWQERPQPTPHIVFKIELHSNTRVWTVQRRYSEFDAFHDQLLQLFPSAQLPPLPPKQRNPFKSKSIAELEERRLGLQNYLHSILRSSFYAEFEESELWRNFVKVPIKATTSLRTQITAIGRSVDADGWMDEYRELESLSREILALVNYSKHPQSNNTSISSYSSNDTNNNSTSLASSNASTIWKSDKQRLDLAEARKLFASLNLRLKVLSDTLSKQEIMDSLTDGEILRRRDLISNLKMEKEKLSTTMSTFSYTQDRSALLSSSASSSYPSSPAGLRTRVFGVPLETEDTKSLDNRGILELQDEMIKNQDEHIENLYDSVLKQKDLGLAISSELDIQNKMLVELEQKVDQTSTRMKGVSKAADKLAS